MAEALDTAPFLDKWAEQTVTYNRRDLLTYAVGIGCDELEWVYEKNRQFQAFPTYPIVLPFKGTSQDVLNFPSKAMTQGAKRPPLPGIKVVLDGQRYLEVVNPLPKKGAELVLRERLISVQKKGSGASVETETILQGKDGKVYTKIVSGTFLVGANGFKNSGASAFSKVEVPKRGADKTLEFKTTETMAQVYRLSGDYNPLHVCPKFAKTSGFEAPILHGLCTFAISVRQVLKAFASSDGSLYKASSVRFAKPVLPGQTLVVSMWQVSPTRIVFSTSVKETGVAVLNNAFLELTKPVTAGAKL